MGMLMARACEVCGCEDMVNKGSGILECVGCHAVYKTSYVGPQIPERCEDCHCSTLVWDGDYSYMREDNVTWSEARFDCEACGAETVAEYDIDGAIIYTKEG